MACSFENYATYAPAKSRIKVFDFHQQIVSARPRMQPALQTGRQ
jgi:hypothetical protein